VSGLERAAARLRASPQVRAGQRAAVLRVITALNLVLPKRAGRIVVHSVPDLEDGALALLDGLTERGHAPVVLAEDRGTAGLANRLLQRPVRVVPKLSVRGLYLYLTARHVLTTHGLYPSRALPRRQVLVNIWHGEPLTKPVGRWEGRPPVPATVSTALSKLGQAFRCAEFDLDPAQVLVVGAPRNDRLLTADRAEVRAALGVGDSTTLFCWLPTYRTATRRSHRADGEPYPGGLPLDEDGLRALDDHLGDRDAVLLVKAHPLTAPSPAVARCRHVRGLDGVALAALGTSLYPLLAGVDCLITDVSSVWIDFLLTDRPQIFMFPDRDAYAGTRGLHLEPYDVWVPGPTPRTAEELLVELDRVLSGSDDWAARRADTRARLHAFPDAHSTTRLLDTLGL